MKRVAIILTCLAGTAAAAPGVTPPKGWIPDEPTAISLSRKLAAVPHFGGVPAIVATEAYRAPTGKGALYLTRVAANIKPEDRNKAATAELDEIRASMRRQGAAEPWAPSANPDTKLLVAALSWRDASTNLAISSVTIVAADAQQLVAITGECIFAAEVVAEPTNELAPACREALRTLDPGIEPGTRVALTLAGDPAATSPVTAPSMGPSTAPLLGDGERPKLEPKAFPQQSRDQDRRPIYVGGGLVVLALVFWWNRRRRERFEADYDARAKRTGPDQPEDEAADAGVSGDGDADDLHAAASGQDVDATKEDKKS